MRDVTKVGLVAYFFIAIAYILQEKFLDLSLGFYLMGGALFLIWYLITRAEDELLNEVDKIRRKKK